MEKLTESEQRRLKQLNDRQTSVIINYCNTIGCKDCPLNRKPDPCESNILQDEIMDLEFKEL